MQGFCRPRFVQLAGTPHIMEFDIKSGSFHVEFDADSTIPEPSVLYIPRVQFPRGFTLDAKNAKTTHDKENQLLLVHPISEGRCSITVTRKGKFDVDLEDDEAESD
ncbi:MAG: hypothetical protein ACFFCT_14735 [Candidatus Odinarchaeota archaeon]